MTDPRRLQSGLEIPTEAYSDQPYLVKTRDGAWLLTVTTGAGREGEHGQHVVSMRSEDRGRTWSCPVDVEPADGPESSYSVLLCVPSGRIYCFYNHNTDDLRYVLADDPPFPGGLCRRVDSQGHFVFRYTDDGGLTWSPLRYEIPQRLFAIDRENPYEGKILFFWNVGKPFVSQGRAYVPIHKVGGFGEGFFTRSEGALLCSENLLTESDPEKIRWVTLPEGEIGLRAPEGAGPIAEEQSFVVASDGSIHANYRTVSGHPACCVSRDGGRTFSLPDFRRYPDGHSMRHPRAANFTWRCENGNYLYWFHNHGGRGYDDRNPVWLSGGVETDGPEGRGILWSQPEILLYDDDPRIRVSYPDLLEDGGEYYLTETQKDVARVHRLDREMLEDLWAQSTLSRRAETGLLLDLRPEGSVFSVPPLPVFSESDPDTLDARTRRTRAGIALTLDFPGGLPAGIVLFSSLDSEDRGILVETERDGCLRFICGDGRGSFLWRTDPIPMAGTHRVNFILDSGPCLLLTVLDGLLQDGGMRQFGFGRFSPNLRTVSGGDASVHPAIRRVKLHGRALRVTEAIADLRWDLSLGEL